MAFEPDQKAEIEYNRKCSAPKVSGVEVVKLSVAVTQLTNITEQLVHLGNCGPPRIDVTPLHCY